MDKEVLNKIKYLINKKKTVEEICAVVNFEYNDLLLALDYLKAIGNCYNIKDSQIFKMSSDYIMRIPPLNGTNEIEICFVSDLHYGSIFDNPELMLEIYKECLRRGIYSIFCAGDLTDGFYPDRQGYDKRQKIKGYDAMLEYVINIHPYSESIVFYTIAGNHDKTFLNLNNKDICEDIAKIRSDIVYLGNDFANVLVDKIRLHINHGYYNCRGSLQERAEQFYHNLNFGPVPDIIELGHLHHSLYTQINSAHIFQTAALTNQKIPNIALEKSCWFIKIRYDDFGNITHIIPELKVFEADVTRKLVI